MRRGAIAVACLWFWPVTALADGANDTRIKDIVSVQGARGNHLFGYGLVIGLNGTGDSLRSAPFTQQSFQSMLDRMGVNIRTMNARTRNIAAVMVMGELPAFATPGGRMDVTVASMGDATSLSGGSLLLTALQGADGQIYAVAQGPVAVSGFQAGGRNETVSQGTPTAGRIPNGALVERASPAQLEQSGVVVIELRNPDYDTAVQVAEAINAMGRVRFSRPIAQELDNRRIAIKVPPRMPISRLIAEIGNERVRPDVPARVVIDERTGTIIVGKDVQIMPVAVSHGSLNIRVSETPLVSQPAPFSQGRTVTDTESQVEVSQQGDSMGIVSGASLQALVAGLNQMGLKPTGIIAVLQAIKSAGALQAELVVQ
ncbi:MAG: flagellar basal body P-ring protein FlgI [Hyphomicrobium sp.]|nr:flagellar basal body P-ring protein FlgI [Hyphomicrobium sp.]